MRRRTETSVVLKLKVDGYSMIPILCRTETSVVLKLVNPTFQAKRGQGRTETSVVLKFLLIIFSIVSKSLSNRNKCCIEIFCLRAA